MKEKRLSSQVYTEEERTPSKSLETETLIQERKVTVVVEREGRDLACEMNVIYP